MDAVIETLLSFVKNHISWEPDRFNKIQDEELRKAVRAAFREPSNFIPNLLQTGSKEDMEAFSEAVKDKVYPMYSATLAGFLEMLYSQEVRELPYSKVLVVWFREKGWQFPQFGFEKNALCSSPALSSQLSVKVEKLDID